MLFYKNQIRTCAPPMNGEAFALSNSLLYFKWASQTTPPIRIVVLYALCTPQITHTGCINVHLCGLVSGKVLALSTPIFDFPPSKPAPLFEGEVATACMPVYHHVPNEVLSLAVLTKNNLQRDLVSNVHRGVCISNFHLSVVYFLGSHKIGLNGSYCPGQNPGTMSFGMRKGGVFRSFFFFTKKAIT